MSQAYHTDKGLRVNTDGTTIKDRKPRLKLCPNHFKQYKIRPQKWWTGGALVAVAGGYKSINSK
jgi:hypothetical protein